MKKEKIKIKRVIWELAPIITEKYIDEDELKMLSEIDDYDEQLEYIDDILGEVDDFIYTSEGTDYLSPYYEEGELNKFYIKSNEHSIYITSSISIDNITVSTYFDNDVIKKN